MLQLLLPAAHLQREVVALTVCWHLGGTVAAAAGGGHLVLEEAGQVGQAEAVTALTAGHLVPQWVKVIS